MEELDGDDNPIISIKGIKRQRDLVQFVPFNKFEGDENKLAYEVLEEIPRQIIEYYTLNYDFPEEFNGQNEDIINNNPLNEQGQRDELFPYTSFRLFDNKTIKNDPIRNIDKKNNYFTVNEMFNIVKKMKNLNIIIPKSARNFNLNNYNKNFFSSSVYSTNNSNI